MASRGWVIKWIVNWELCARYSLSLADGTAPHLPGWTLRITIRNLRIVELRVYNRNAHIAVLYKAEANLVLKACFANASISA